MVQNITRVVVTPATATVDVGNTQGFSAQVWSGATPVFSSQQTVTWTSSNPAVGTIDSNGLFTAVALGQTIITATVGGVFRTASVTVQQPTQQQQGAQGGGSQAPQNNGNAQRNTSEVKSSVVLLAILLYILSAYFGVLGVAFSLLHIFILITFLVTIVSLDFDNLKTKWHEAIPAGLWLVLFILGLVTNNFSSESYFLMLAAAIATAMELKSMIIFLGTAIISMVTFNASVIGFIVLLVVFLFIYAASESIPFGVIMMVPLLIVGWFIGSGWGDIVEQKVASINTEISVSTGISTGSIGDQLSSALNNTWLLLTDPNAWYDKTYVVDASTRDQGLTSAALEVTKIEALPTSVLPLDTFDVVFELENKGTKDAVGVTVGAKGDTFADACGRFSGLYCNPKCVDLITNPDTILASCVVKKTLDKIAPMERGFDTFTFQAPECPGAYKVGAAVRYNYSVETTMNMQMISRDYYTELLRNNKMKWSDEISLTSAGPFKMSLRTSPTQPIPDRISPDVPQVFKVYLGLVNEKPGMATMGFATIRLPKDIELDAWDYTNNKIDESCSIAYDADLKLKDGDAATASECQTNIADPSCLSFMQAAGILNGTNEMTKDAYDTLALGYRNAFKAKADAEESEYITYQTLDPAPERKFLQGEWRYYKCGFKYAADAPPIDQIKTFFMRAELPYSFEYEKYASVSVRSVTGAIPPQCRKDLKPVSAISTAQTKPQTKDAVLSMLANEIYYCYSKNDGYIYDTSAKCGTFKINLEECGTGSITSEDIISKLSSTPKYLETVVNDSNQNLFVREMDGTVVDLRTETKDIFKDTDIYTINMEYVANYYTPSLLGIALGPVGAVLDVLKTKNTLIMTKQTVIADSVCAQAVPAAAG